MVHDRTMNIVQELANAETASFKVRRSRAVFSQWSVGIMIAAFAVLTILVVTIETFSIDVKITLSLQTIDHPFFSGVMTYISWAGFFPQVLVVTLIIISITYYLGFRWEGAVSFVAAGAVSLLNSLVKILVHRERPSVDLVAVNETLTSFSFPSGHVMFYSGFFGFIWFLSFTLLKPSWKRAMLLIFFGGHVSLVGISRVYLGEHWTSDTVGAYLLGSLCLIAIIQLYRWGKSRYFIQ